MKNFNNYLATKITDAVATMACFYFFCILAIIGFPYNDLSPHSIVQWLSQTFIQLTMLSILAVAQKLISTQAKELHNDGIKLAHKNHKEHLVNFQRIHDHNKGVKM